MEELRTKMENRDRAKEQLEQKRAAMAELRGRISDAEAQQMSSSTRSAKEKRGKYASDFSMEDELSGMEEAVKLLEETYADAVKELKDFEDMLERAT